MPETSGVYQQILPSEYANGHNSELLGKFADFLFTINAIANSCPHQADVTNWLKWLNNSMESIYLLDDYEIEHSVNVNKSLQQLTDTLGENAKSKPIDKDVLALYLKNKLNDQNKQHYIPNGKLTFANLTVMSGIPFKIICFLGMNSTNFPSCGTAQDFDLMAAKPRAGDELLKDRNKYAFLQALLVAETKVHISFVGQSINDNSIKLPSIVIEEVLDYCKNAFNINQSQLIYQHPLQPFSKNNFQSIASNFFSYAGKWVAVNNLATSNQQNIIQPELSDNLTLTNLIKFFKDPVKHFYNNYFGIFLDEPEEILADSEPFEIDNLQKYNLNRELIKLLFNQQKADDFRDLNKASGILPYNLFGKYLLNDLEKTITEIIPKLGGLAVDLTANSKMSINLATELSIEAEITGLHRDNLVFIYPNKKPKGKHIIEAWLSHLCCCCQQATTTHILTLEKYNTLTAVPQEQAINCLNDLSVIYQQGLTRPLPWLADIGYKWLEKTAKINPDTADLNYHCQTLIEDYINDSMNKRSSYYLNLVYPNIDSYYDEFNLLTEKIMRPINEYLPRLKEKIDKRYFNMQLLNIWELPFAGLQLIEASAGTGKTYTLANLYLRAIIGHTQTNNATPLTVDQILVVTFTEAATEELKDRIRRRIAVVRTSLLKKKLDDSFIKNIAQLPNQKEIIQLLLHAEQQMDEAAIFTIHGFCNKVLKQYAFKSGLLFSCDLATDINPILQQAVEDFWRDYIYNLEHAELIAPLIWNNWKTPEALLKTIKGVLFIENTTITPKNLPANLAVLYDKYIKEALELKQYWCEHQEIIDLLENGGLKGNSATFRRLAKLKNFLASDDLLPDFNTKIKDEDWEAFSNDTIIKNTKKNNTPLTHDGITKVDNWLAKPYKLRSCLKAMVIGDALLHIKARFQQLKDENQQMGFDDLLINLAKGLGVYNGTNTKTQDNHLAEELRQQYPLAMIDEFQDTDSLQYNIFHKIYHNQQASLLMIGDPKQAIYAFRGADIFTYLQAKHEVCEKYNLDTNWRSSAAMIDAVNTIFSQASNPFLFNQDIDFNPVKAAAEETAKNLFYLNKQMPALQIWYQQEKLSKKQYQLKVATAVATEIAQLLNVAANNQAIIQHKANKTTALQQSDIAILVQDKNEAAIIKKALLQANLSSVYLSARDSVFDSIEAEDLLRILLACNDPASAKKIKAALASSIFALNVAELEQRIFNTELWDQIVLDFTDFKQLFINQGALVMLQKIMQQFDVVAKINILENGERKLTNFYHLSQLLAVAAEQHATLPQLIRWLEKNIQIPNNNATEQQLHLENEQQLVKIITIHKSKGLEYPVVFIPFVASQWVNGKNEICLHHNNSQQQAQLALIATTEDQEYQAQEQLAEKLRLLYVALTRAAVCCYVAVAPVLATEKSTDNLLNKTAIGYLINQGQPILENQLEELLENIKTKANFANSIAITAIPQTATTFNQQQQTDDKIIIQQFDTEIETNWQLSSYSALVKNQPHKYQYTPEKLYTPKRAFESQGCDYTDISQFPRGSKAGIFLHNLFEKIHFITKLTAIKQLNYISKLLANFNYETAWAEAILTLLKNCQHAYLLTNETMCWNDITPDKQRQELNFCLSVNNLMPINSIS